MNQSKKQQKNSEIDNEQALKKRQSQQANDAAVDLPSVVQRVANDSTRRPGDILALQRTVGNQVVQRLLENGPDSTVTPGTVQRHIADEQSSAVDSAVAQEQAAIAQGYQGTLGVEAATGQWREGSSGMVQGFNALLRATGAAGSEQSTAEAEGGGGGSQSPQTGGGTQSAPSGGESQSATSGEDIYEGGGGSQSSQTQEEIVVPAAGGI